MPCAAPSCWSTHAYFQRSRSLHPHNVTAATGGDVVGGAVVLEVAPAPQRVSVGAVCPCGPSLVLGERVWLGLLLLPGQQAGGEALTAARLHVRPHGGEHLVSIG